MSSDAVSSDHRATPYPTPYPAPYPTPYPGAGAPVLAGPPAGGPQPFAGWWRRVAAWLVDYLLAVVPYVLGVGVGLALVTEVPDPRGGTTDQFTTGTGIAFALGALGALAVVVANRYLRQGRRGQSLGKQALGIRLVSAQDAQPIGAATAFGRDMAHVLDGILSLGYLWPLWDPMKQTFADKIVGSVVVRDR